MVSKFANSPIAKNKPIVGENAFAHCSGMHQHGVLSDRENYEIMDPADLGIKASGIIIGKYSGKHGIKHVLENANINLDDQELNKLMKQVKLVDEKKILSVKELIGLIN